MKTRNVESLICCYEYKRYRGTQSTFSSYKSLCDYIRTTDDVLSWKDKIVITTTSIETTMTFEEFFNRFKADILSVSNY